MRPLIFLLLAFFTLAIAAPAFALSIDNETGLNTDGSTKYTDPDDQEPNLLNTPLHAPGSGQSQSNGMQIFPGAHFSVTGGPADGQSQQQQQDAFDHAYAHFGN